MVLNEDDFLICSCTWEEHLTQLSEAFDRLKKANFKSCA